MVLVIQNTVVFDFAKISLHPNVEMKYSFRDFLEA